MVIHFECAIINIMIDDLSVVSRAKLANRVSIEERAEEKAAQLGIPYFDLRETSLLKDVLENFEAKELLDYGIVPIGIEDDVLIIASPEPESEKVSEFKENHKKNFPQITVGIVSGECFEEVGGILSKVVKRAAVDPAGEVDVSEVDVSKKSFEEFQKNLNASDIQSLLKVAIVEGFALSASDIHIEPGEKDVKIRFRIDGVLHDAAILPKEQYKYIRSQVELKSGLKLNVKYPQNGRFKVKFKDEELNVRIEVMPSLYGEDIVIRIFNMRAELLRVSDLGIRDVQIPILESALIRPHGMILIVGPTGSGKTTTIYAILNKLNSPEIKLITLEDPVEYTLKGATQSQINEGEGFAERLKAVLREDPDVILLGEIRDSETAKTALQAAITGHLLVTTLHANDAVTSVPRILGLVDDTSSFLDAVNIIISQRLVRKICPNCIEKYEPNKGEMLEIQKILNSLPIEHKPQKSPTFFHGKGCKECNQIGYKGRLGIFEFLQVSPEFQKAATKNPTLHELKEVAISGGMLTMEQDGFLKAVEGIVDVVEVLKVIKE